MAAPTGTAGIKVKNQIFVLNLLYCILYFSFNFGLGQQPGAEQVTLTL